MKACSVFFLFVSLVTSRKVAAFALFSSLNPSSSARARQTSSRRWKTPRPADPNDDDNDSSLPLLPNAPHKGQQRQVGRRRQLLLAGATSLAACWLPSAALAYRIEPVEPIETDIYALAQKAGRRVLWVGAGQLESSYYHNLFLPQRQVTVVDLVLPTEQDWETAQTYAANHDFAFAPQPVQADATKLPFDDQSFDVVVTSKFLCQDFDPAVVASEIRRVLKPGGRYGFYEDVEDIHTVVVDKVFGPRSVIRVQHLPERKNIMAGVVRKV